MFGFWLGVGKLKNASSQNIRLIKKSKTRKIDKWFKKGKWAKEDKVAPANKIRIFWQIKKRHLPHTIFFLKMMNSFWDFRIFKENNAYFLSSFFCDFQMPACPIHPDDFAPKPDTDALKTGLKFACVSLLMIHKLWKL